MSDQDESPVRKNPKRLPQVPPRGAGRESPQAGAGCARRPLPKEHGVGRGKSDFKTQEAGERTGRETQLNFNRGKALPLTRGDENGIYLCGLPPQSL